MARKPAFDMVEIPAGNHPAWQVEDNRYAFQEDMRIHLYQALDNLNRDDLPDKEREKWEEVIAVLGSLAQFYKAKGYNIHIH